MAREPVAAEHIKRQPVTSEQPKPTRQPVVVSIKDAKPIRIRLPIEELVRRLGAESAGKTEEGWDWWKAHCPAHSDDRSSLTFHWNEKKGRYTWKCHAGCASAEIERAMLTWLDAHPTPRETTHSPRGPRVASYPYTSLDGAVSYIVDRHEPGEDGRTKDFLVRRPDGQYGLGGLPPLLYHLPQLKDKTVICTPEGERKVEALEALGFVATTNHGGASSWFEEHTEQLRHAGCTEQLIFPDNDDSGAKRTEKLATLAHTHGIKVKVVTLPGLPPKGDIVDWVEAGGTREQLEEIIEAAPVWGQSDAAPTLELLLDTDRFHATDTGNAMRFETLYRGEVHYSDKTGWLVWSGQRWERDSQEAAIGRAVRMVLAIGARAANLDNKDMIRFMKECEGQRRLNAMTGIAKSQGSIPTSPDKFDADPWLLNVRNGTIDLKTGTLREHRREDLITKLAPVDYDPDAPCPLFDAFLQKVQPDEEVRSFIQRTVGYALTGSIREDALNIWHGVGANGKSTLLGILHRMLDDYAQVMPAETLMTKKNEAHPTEIARLRGARLVAAIETKAGRRFDESHVKSLTGGDPLTGRFMRQDFFDFMPSHKIFLAVNHLPEITDSTESFWRRVYLTPWEVTIPKEEQDDALEDKIVQAELPGVLAWAVRGCLDWQAHKLNPPAAVQVAKDEYRAEQDQLSLFIKAHLVLGKTLTVPVADLHKRYADWFVKINGAPNPADSAGYSRRDTVTQLSLRALCDRLIETLRVKRARIGHGQVRSLQGCGLTTARVDADRIDPAGRVR